MTNDERALARFWDKVSFGEHPNSCWTWSRALSRGYGKFSFHGRTVRAHRWIYVRTFGVLPAGQAVRHLCDRPACVRLDHLIAGTQSENMHDMKVRGRASCGERHWSAKVSNAEVLEIRRLYAEGGSTQAALGSLYKISQSQVSRIVNRTKWARI